MYADCYLPGAVVGEPGLAQALLFLTESGLYLVAHF